MTPKENPIIIALDSLSPLKALHYVRKLKVTGVAFKIGFELFLQGGRRFVEKVISHDVRVFLDLKFHDIPNTVEAASVQATKMGVWMFNVHAAGGEEMLRRAASITQITAEKQKITKPKLIAVTVLTSMQNLAEIGIQNTVDHQVKELAQLTQRAGLDGVVASALEIPLLRNLMNDDFLIVTPGIRMDTSIDNDDQKRLATPSQAITNGSNYLVIGRPILQSKRPLKTLDEILLSV